MLTFSREGIRKTSSQLVEEVTKPWVNMGIFRKKKLTGYSLSVITARKVLLCTEELTKAVKALLVNSFSTARSRCVFYKGVVWGVYVILFRQLNARI